MTITTAAAATQAGVTVDTIRTWCRRGVVAAVKAAGRWVIDTTSLAHRIAIGQRKVRMTDSPRPGTMAADKDRDYIKAWPEIWAGRAGLSVEYVAQALITCGYATKDREYPMRSALLRDEYLPEVAALTPDAAREVIATLNKISSDIDAAAKTNCWCCGGPLRNGNCNSCGDMDDIG